MTHPAPEEPPHPTAPYVQHVHNHPLSTVASENPLLTKLCNLLRDLVIGGVQDEREQRVTNSANYSTYRLPRLNRARRT
jgi:hypothetical protein